MKAYVVKAKAKLGKLPSKEICRDLLYEDSLERKLDIIRANKSEIPNIYSKKDVEIFLSNSLYDDLNSFLKFLKGEEKNFFIKYISKFELQLIQLIVQAILNEHLKDSLDIIKREKFSQNINVSKDDDFQTFVEKSKSTRYYRTLYPFLNENMQKNSIIFLISNSLNKFYYRDLLEETKKLPKNLAKELREFIGREIDIFNIEMLFRLKNYFILNDYEIFNYLIEGGKYLKTEDLKKLSKLSLDKVKERILGSPYNSLFNNSSNFYKAKKDLLSDNSKRLNNSKYDLLKLIYIVDMMEVSNKNIISMLEFDETFDKDEKKHYIIKR
ncbi:V-type ATPase subunit [Anaerococcus obesiensis]|uniref:V-type ATPase subunit n=1 Tax=Anaerococcus obesiensis TaxID=1287640 RepID=A0A7T7UTG8_9FIRM|nr:V-type ATPase subunit [Anaerococcus obesiensis]QQN55908.1 V-type ATPase subunit [Anaerococcus obesiensis]